MKINEITDYSKLENEIIDLNEVMTEFKNFETEQYKNFEKDFYNKQSDHYIDKHGAEGTKGIQATDPNIDYIKLLEERVKDVKQLPLPDDSFIEEEDKINLAKAATFKYETEFKSYPYPMNEVIIEKIYYECIRNLNKEDYLREKEEFKKKSIIEKQLMKLDKLTGL
tara:strand:+ start:1711 stop:2211 length:501 start_codon:yes stop_codon:yes gene_type:complete